MTDQFDQSDNYKAEGWDEQGEATEVDVSLPPVIPPMDILEPQEIIERDIYVPDQKPVGFKQERNPTAAAIEGETPVLAFIRENPNTITAVLDRCNDVLKALQEGKMAESERDKRWLASIISGMQHTGLENTPYGAVEREGSMWQDGVELEGVAKLIRPGSPKPVNDKSRKTTKENQLAYLNYRSGNGGTFEAFLPRSGLWVRMRQPTLDELVTLQTELQALKLNLGAETKGASFSHADFMMLDLITNLALSCVIGCNKSFNTPSDLEYEITIFDEPILHHGLASTLFPAGFNFTNPCIADPDACSHVDMWKMNMANIVYYDNAVFNADQKKFIAKRFTPASDEEFVEYRKQFGLGNPKVIWLENIGLKIAEPTVAARKASAKQWFDGLIEMSQGVFNEPPHGSNRLNYIQKLKNATIATQFAHWVTAIYDLDEDAVNFEDQLFTDDPDLILEYMRTTLSTPEKMAMFQKEINDFCNASIIGLVGLVSHNCSVCQTPQGLAFNERLPHIVPIDMTTTFFTLAARKVLHLQR